MMRYAHVVSRHSHRHQIRHRTTMHRQIMQHSRHSLTDSRRVAHRDSSMGSHRAAHRDSSTGSAQSQAFDNFTQQVSAAGQQLQNDKNVASIITFYKGLVKKPAQAAADFVKNANMASGFIFIGLFAIVEVVLSVVYLLSSVIGSIGGFGFSFYPASFFEGIFSGIVGEAVRVLILAAVILVVLNAVQKDKKVTFAQTLSAACLYDAVYLPIILVAAIIDIIPFQFFGNVSSWLHTFAGVVGYVSIFFGVRAIEEDDNKLPLVCGLAFLATAIGSTIVNAIF